MCQLFESIKVYRHEIYNLPYHEDRVNRSRAELWKIEEPVNWQQQLTIPAHLGEGLYKCRVTYGPEIQRVEFLSYRATPIRSLKIVCDDMIAYTHKYQDRQALLSLREQRGNCDDILIVKNHWVTDTSYCNVACWSGEKWYTPAKPLLAGTQRASLIAQEIVHEEDIRIQDLNKFKKLKLINALLDFESAPVIPISCIL
ncbi:MAG: aminotransferase class IV [Cyanophyceae cyanobacterium]